MREDGRSYAKRRRLDARLGLAMLARLHRMAETRAQAGEEMLAQIIAGDWPGLLSLFDAAAAAPDAQRPEATPDRNRKRSVVGKRASVRLHTVGRRCLKKQNA